MNRNHPLDRPGQSPPLRCTLHFAHNLRADSEAASPIHERLRPKSDMIEERPSASSQSPFAGVA